MENIAILPLDSPFDVSIELPGSKSHTNRALLCAALADGTSHLSNWLDSEDTQAMLDALGSIGTRLTLDGSAIDVSGLSGLAVNEKTQPIRVSANRSGTTARFLLPALSFSEGEYVLDGDSQLQARPFGDQVRSLNQLGANLKGESLPIEISGATPSKNSCQVSGQLSSQFLSGLLLVGPVLPQGLNIEVQGELVSKPYVSLTLDVMNKFGAAVDFNADLTDFKIAPTRYRGANIEIEPDASAASYFMAAAAVSKSTVEIVGLSRSSIQGDIAFAEILRSMGAEVSYGSNSITVTGPEELVGVEVNMSDCSDVAQTLAVVAASATGETVVSGIGFIRNKETDRVGSTVAELKRCGVSAQEFEDGFVVQASKVQPAKVQTYDDHRMAMSFSVLGLTNAGIEIENPRCVDKTFPEFFKTLNRLY